jgi:acyl-CoA dehydrogenase
MTEPIANTRFPYFSEEHEMLRTTIRRFIADKVVPVADAWEEQGFVPRDVLREMGALGLLGMRYAPEYGGSGLDTLANAVLAEELGRSTYGGFAVTVLVHTDMASPHLFHAGTPDQLERWMPDITAGRKITAVAMTEADAGSDLASMRTTARKVAGGYVLNGAKMFITNGVHGDLVFVAAKSGEAGRNRTMSMFAVEKGMPGFTVARALKKTGWLSSDTAELVLEDCFVPEENLLGEEGRGFYALVRNLQNERIVLAAQALGEAMKAIEITLDWVKQRRAFGTALWDKQTIRQRLAMRLAQVEAARAFLFNTAWRDTQQENVVKEVSMLKALAGTLVNEVLYDCVQFHGGMGYMRESAVERMARDARVQSIGGGATEVMLEEVAKRI